MSCILNSGVSLGCKDSIGGIKEAYIASFSSSAGYTYDSDDVIDSISNTNNFHTFAQRNEQGEMVQTGNHSIENGSNYWEQVVSLIFTKNDATLRNTLKVLAQSTLSVIVKDQNNRYWLIGEENGADLSASTASTGKAYGDLNGVTLSIMAKESNPARQISQTAFDSLPVT